MDATTLGEFKKVLEDMRAHLEVEIAGIERDSAVNLSETSGENNYRDHMADQGTATFGKELDMSIEDNVRGIHDEVLAALARIESGSYGTCTRCGNEIPVERLQALPAAGLCITCKEWEESR